MRQPVIPFVAVIFLSMACRGQNELVMTPSSGPPPPHWYQTVGAGLVEFDE